MIINNYSNQNFSYEENVLPAVGALAEEIASQTGFIYKAGLWQEDMHRGLLGRTAESRTTFDHYKSLSWSWTSFPSSAFICEG
jgi:hypothetical protein